MLTSLSHWLVAILEGIEMNSRSLKEHHFHDARHRPEEPVDISDTADVFSLQSASIRYLPIGRHV